MAADRDTVARELDLLSELLESTSDPQVASLSVAIYLEDAAGVRLTDEQIESGLPRLVDRSGSEPGSGEGA